MPACCRPPAGRLYARAAAPAGEDQVFTAISEIMDELARITDRSRWPRFVTTRSPKKDVKPFLEERVKEAVKPEEIRAEEAALKKLGFVPRISI